MLKSLVGSEMCIRDSARAARHTGRDGLPGRAGLGPGACLLYTSDAADERSSVDLGGGRIIKKKIFFFQAEDGIRDAQESRGLGDVYKRQCSRCTPHRPRWATWPRWSGSRR